MLSFKENHMLTLIEEFKEFSFETIWKKIQTHIGRFIHKEILQCFSSTERPWVDNSIKYALVLSQISTLVDDWKNLVDFMKSIMFSKNFKTTEDISETWRLIRGKYDLWKMAGRNTSPEIFKIFAWTGAFDFLVERVDQFFEWIKAGGTVKSAEY